MGTADALEARIAILTRHVAFLIEALKPLSYCNPEKPPAGVAVADWRDAERAARAALSKATEGGSDGT